MFSSGFLGFLVILGLIWTALGAVALVLLLIKDWQKNELW